MTFAIPAASIAINSLLTKTLPSYLAVGGAAIMFLGIFVSSWTEDGKAGLSRADPVNVDDKEDSSAKSKTRRS